ncbi:MAG TPA: glutaredoxin, partial [Methanoculleus sp.]|nr:glutaredoxin [Methanoculleus sp.]
GIFAAGDATCIKGKQIIIAAGEGAKAALEAHEYLIKKGLSRAPLSATL